MIVHCNKIAVLAIALLAVALPTFANAQEFSIDLGGDGSLSARSVQLIALITVLSLAPGIAIMVTCFPFVVTVLSLLRQGLGLQQSPPNMLIVSLALFMTYFIMDPVFREAWETGVSPMVEGAIDLQEGFLRTIEPFRLFMTARVDEETLARLIEIRQSQGVEAMTNGRPDLSVLVPSFLLSEIEKAFQIGFLIFLPFLIIDMVVAAILMSMGMMMVPPAIVSLPFKLAFFVVVDGWTLLSEALLRSYM